MIGAKCDITGEWFENIEKYVEVEIVCVNGYKLYKVMSLHIGKQEVPEEILNSLELCGENSTLIAISNFSTKSIGSDKVYTQPMSERINVEKLFASKNLNSFEGHNNTISIDENKDIKEFINQIEEVSTEYAKNDSYTESLNKSLESLYPLDENQEKIKRNKKKGQSLDKSIEEQLEQDTKESLIYAYNRKDKYSISASLMKISDKYIINVNKGGSTAIKEYDSDQKAADKYSEIIDKYDMKIIPNSKDKARELGVIEEQEEDEQNNDTDKSFL